VTFGNTKAKTIKTKYVKVDVRLNNGKYVQITANIVPLISCELQRKPTSDLFSDKVNDILSTVQLADTMPKESESSSIEFLIGNNYYLDFVNKEKLECKVDQKDYTHDLVEVQKNIQQLFEAMRSNNRLLRDRSS
jgi:hypothetical protein